MPVHADVPNATPISRGQFIAAKLIPFWIVAMIELMLGLTLARLLFGIPMEGSLLIVFLAAAIFLVGALGLGLCMPRVIQWVAQANPITHFVVIMRAVLVRGAGIADVAGRLAILALFAAAIFTLAVRQHHKTSA